MLGSQQTKERKRVVSALRAIYRAGSESEAEQQLEVFEQDWGAKYTPIGQLWRRHWQRVRPLCEFPAEIRKVIKTRGAFPSEEATTKLLYLALRNVANKWQHIRGWREALNHFTLLWGEYTSS